ncbi:CatB-related O-acetyltransferase [Neobacillus niacini]|uniref:CatB-related O-acetyltransferase n=1 Tax=Neobacillus niacini TaxID=86668 RepID=UPI0030002D2B
MNIRYLVSKFIKRLQIPAIIDSNIDKLAKVCSGSHLVESNIGRYSYIGNFCTVINTDIGQFCSVADNVIIGGGSHPIDWVSTSPVFHDGRNIFNKNFSSHKYSTRNKTIIGNDVWIGSGVIIKSGVSIGDGAIIGMGSVVTKDVESYSIVAGNPARLIRNRFDKNTKSALEELKWWNWNEQKINSYAIYFKNVSKFVEEGKK